jgi:hypothetical protein
MNWRTGVRTVPTNRRSKPYVCSARGTRRLEWR